jgi:hypothetical protein
LSNQVPTIGLGNAQQFENYKNIYPRYTSIQGSVVQTLQVSWLKFASANFNENAYLSIGAPQIIYAFEMEIGRPVRPRGQFSPWYS